MEPGKVCLQLGICYSTQKIEQRGLTDGVVQKHRWQYSNILKISRILNLQDNRL